MAERRGLSFFGAVRFLLVWWWLLVCLGLKKAGLWMDDAFGRCFDAAMDWIYGHKDWRL